MSNLFWLSEDQFRKIEPLLLNDVRGVPRVDDRRVLSGIIISTVLRTFGTKPSAICAASTASRKTAFIGS